MTCAIELLTVLSHLVVGEMRVYFLLYEVDNDQYIALFLLR